jgi:hypothetical protein
MKAEISKKGGLKKAICCSVGSEGDEMTKNEGFLIVCQFFNPKRFYIIDCSIFIFFNLLLVQQGAD